MKPQTQLLVAHFPSTNQSMEGKTKPHSDTRDGVGKLATIRASETQLIQRFFPSASDITNPSTAKDSTSPNTTSTGNEGSRGEVNNSLETPLNAWHHPHLPT